MLNAETFLQLQQADWEQIYKRLTLYAIKRAQFYGWYDSDTQMLPGRDFTIDDIVQRVIEKTLSGERKWNPAKGSLLAWLTNQIKSVMDAWIKGASGKHELSFGDYENEDNEINEGSASSIKIENTTDVNSPQPEMALLEKEMTIAQSRVFNRAFQAISGDAELEKLFDAITEIGSAKPIDLADYLKVEISEIYNQKKRFQKRLPKLDLEQGQNEKQ